MIIRTAYLDSYYRWLTSWNIEYPFVESYNDIDIPFLAEYYNDYEELKKGIMDEIFGLQSSITNSNEVKEFVKTVNEKREKINFFLEKKLLSFEEYSIRNEEKFNKIFAVYPTKFLAWPHNFKMMYDFVKESFIPINEFIENVFNSISYLEVQSSTFKPIFFNEIKVEHLFILTKALEKYFKQKKLNGVSRKMLAEFFSLAFAKDNGVNYGVGKIYKGPNNMISESRMEQVAQVLYDIANIIDDEIRENKSTDFFK